MEEIKEYIEAYRDEGNLIQIAVLEENLNEVFIDKLINLIINKKYKSFLICCTKYIHPTKKKRIVKIILFR